MADVTEWATTPLGGNAWSAQSHLLPQRASAVIFDCGANEGQALAHYRRLFPLATVYSFEPGPEAFAKLRVKAEADTHVNAINAAIGASVGEATLHLAAQSYADSLVRQPEPDAGGRSGREVTVRVTTVDAEMERLGLDRLDILKLDVEGAELDALEGARQALGRGAIDLVLCELNFKPRHPGQARASQVIEALWAHGYPLFDLYDIARPDQTKGLGWCDGLFLRRDLHPAFEG